MEHLETEADLDDFMRPILDDVGEQLWWDSQVIAEVIVATVKGMDYKGRNVRKTVIAHFSRTLVIATFLRYYIEYDKEVSNKDEES